MAKPVYYLWLDKDTDMEKFNNEKEKFTKAGFDIVIFNNTQATGDLKEALIDIIKNHIR